MSTINDSDLLLVERNGNLHQITYDQMSTLNDDDILLVERGGVQYKVEAQYISTGPNGLIVPPVEVLTPINGAGITEFDQYEPLSSAITTVGGAGTIAKDTDEIQSVVSLATGAANLDRDNNSWINITNGVSIGTSEFTFECFFYVDSFNDWGTIFDTRENYATDNNQIYLGTDSQNRVYFWAVDGSGNYTHRYEKSINTGQWYHLALVRDSNNLMHLYVDGAHATKNSGDYYHSGSINPLTRLGQTQLDGPYDDFVNNLNFEFDGKLSNVRVTVGQALYTSDFTVPPTPLTTTSQNATASNVKLLCCQSTTDVTAAAVSPGSLVANGHAVATSGPGGSDVLLSFPTNTNFSGLSVGDDVSGVNSGSLYLDGDAVIKISSDNDAASIFNIQGHEAFSIEAWVYPTSLGTYNNIMSGWDDNCSHYGVLFHIDGSGQIFFGGLGGATHTSNASNPVTLNNWHHVAVTRNNGGDGEFFIDGVSAGTFNNNNPANSHTCGVFIGANMDGYADGSGGYADYRWHGYISNLRYVVGHQTYTSNFTPSTEPLTPTSQNVPISNCRFLACQDATSFDTNIRPTWNGTSWSLDEVPMTADYGTPVASEQHPWSIEITAIDASATPPTITVDGGTWDTSNQSEVWSSSSNISGTLFEPAYPMSKAFNGVLTFNNNAFAQMNNTATLTFPGGPISFTTLRVYAQKYATSSTATFFVNGTDYTSQLGGSGNTSLGWYTITGETELTSIGLGSYNGASDATGLYAVEVDGKILVDAGTDVGNRVISTPVSYETSLTFSDTTELANMVAPLEMADATGNNSLTPTTSNVVSSSFTPAAPYFSTTLYRGNNQSNRTISTGVDNRGDSLVWIKNRTNATYPAHYLTDTKRGANYQLYTNSDSEHTGPYTNDFQEFLSDGFITSFNSRMNQAGIDYVAWNFRAMPNFFDIVTWTGNDLVREIPHSLGSKPGFIIIKRYDGTEDWTCYHRSLGADRYIQLNGTFGDGSGSSWYMNDTEPTSTHFTVGSHGRVNRTGWKYIAYVFAHSEETSGGSIKCGSYTGNSSTSGPEVDLGFEPAWVMIKCSSSSQGGNAHWVIFDNERDQSNPNSSAISANVTDREYTNSDGVIGIDILPNGFKLKDTNSSRNTSGATYIYIAIAKETGEPAQTEITFQDNTALSALTSGMTIASNGGLLSVPTFSVDTYTGNDSVQSIDNGIDLAGEGGLTWIKYRDGAFGSGHYLFDTERGSASLQSNLSNEQYSPDDRLNFDSSGFNVTINPGQAVNANDYRYVAWSFRKAPGFFDIQTYTGNGDGNGITDLPHDLGSEPGMIIIKRTSAAGGWYVYHKGVTSVNGSSNTPNPAINNYLLLDNTTDALQFSGGSWASTATTFSAPFGINSNFADHQYVAYLFADNPSNGIKCGSYTGTGGDNNDIDCGFKPTWVMIKNVDESGGSNNNKSDWYISDHKRGFSAHYGSMTGRSLSANTSNSELSDATIVVSDTGFKPATGGAEYNKLGVEYIYMAIGSPTAPGGPAIGTLITDADPSTNKVSVDTTSWPTDYTVTGPTASASLTSILEVSGNTIFGNGSNGEWIPGYYAEGSEINAAPPGPSEVTFTSQNQGTPAFSGVDATLTSRTWTLESGATATGPWTVVDTYEDYDVLDSQDGATPWTSNKPNLTPNTFYRVKVRYDSLNAESVESVYNTFKTGSN